MEFLKAQYWVPYFSCFTLTIFLQLYKCYILFADDANFRIGFSCPQDLFTVNDLNLEMRSCFLTYRMIVNPNNTTYNLGPGNTILPIHVRRKFLFKCRVVWRIVYCTAVSFILGIVVNSINDSCSCCLKELFELCLVWCRILHTLIVGAHTSTVIRSWQVLHAYGDNSLVNKCSWVIPVWPMRTLFIAIVFVLLPSINHTLMSLISLNLFLFTLIHNPNF